MEDKNFWNTQIDRFRREPKQAHVVVLHGTNHMFFLDPTQVDDAVRTIKDFLLERQIRSAEASRRDTSRHLMQTETIR